MIKKLNIILILFSFCFLAKAQSFITQFKEKPFNWGGKIGVNAAIPVVNSITINDIEMENVRQQYKVGYQASLFARLNIQHFYIQPAFTWQYTQGDIRFTIPQQINPNPLPNKQIYQNSTSPNKITYKAATLYIPRSVSSSTRYVIAPSAPKRSTV